MVLVECPLCHRKWSLRKKRCHCGLDFDKSKRNQRMKYWIKYRIPLGNGKSKQRREYVGNSVEEAKDADSKRKVQKRENKIFDLLFESKITFSELTKWYLDLRPTKKLSSYDRIVTALKNFNREFGKKQVRAICQMELRNYQIKRQEAGRALSTIDMELKIAQTMVTLAFDNNKIDGRALKAFRKTKRLLTKGRNARRRVITFDEYIHFRDNATSHLLPIFITAFHTGMRMGELRALQWGFIRGDFIWLPIESVKESRGNIENNHKIIPINHHVKKALQSVVRNLDHDYIFSYRGKPITYRNGFRRSFQALCRRVNIPYGRKVPTGVTIHDIRRTFKSNMLAAGVDKAYRDLILGHSLTGMDVHYLVATQDTLRQAMEKYTEWFDRQVKEELKQDPIHRVSNCEVNTASGP